LHGAALVVRLARWVQAGRGCRGRAVRVWVCVRAGARVVQLLVLLLLRVQGRRRHLLLGGPVVARECGRHERVQVGARLRVAVVALVWLRLEAGSLHVLRVLLLLLLLLLVVEDRLLWWSVDRGRHRRGSLFLCLRDNFCANFHDLSRNGVENLVKMVNFPLTFAYLHPGRAQSGF